MKSSFSSFIHKYDISIKKKMLQTTASLKFIVLNPKRCIWTMVARRGASVIYADTVGYLLSALKFFRMGLKPSNFVGLILIYSYNLLANQVGDLGFVSKLGNYVEYSRAPNKEEVLQYTSVVIDVRTLALYSHCIVAYSVLIVQFEVVETLGNLLF